MDLNEALNLTKALLKENNLEEWKVEFMNSKCAFGICNYTTKTIQLSHHLVSLNDESRVKSTILHEIAHALCPHCGHNKVWKQMAIKLGSSGNRCYNSKETITPPAKYNYKCNHCGKIYKRSRRLKYEGVCTDCFKLGIKNLKLELV